MIRGVIRGLRYVGGTAEGKPRSGPARVPHYLDIAIEFYLIYAYKHICMHIYSPLWTYACLLCNCVVELKDFLLLSLSIYMCVCVFMCVYPCVCV